MSEKHRQEQQGKNTPDGEYCLPTIGEYCLPSEEVVPEVFLKSYRKKLRGENKAKFLAYCV